MSEEVVEGGGNVIALPSLKHVMSLEWRERANCAGLPKSTFFDYNTFGLKKIEREQRTSVALRACADCPVRDKCYEFAVLNNEPHGIWAGTFPKERKYLYNQYLKTGILEPLPTA